MSEETVNKIRKFFKDKPVIKAYLFGSYARNEQDNGSDIDILVELDYVKHIGIEFIRMQREIQEFLDTKVDLVSANGVSKYIEPYIEKDKILIYDRKIK